MSMTRALPPAEPHAATALATSWQRVRGHAPRTLLVLVLLCIGIGALISLLSGHWRGTHFVYSFAIGGACMVLTQALRLAQAFAADVWQLRRGLPPGPAGFERGWRGVMPATVIGVLAGLPLGQTLADALTGFESPSLIGGGGDVRMTIAMTLLGTAVSVIVLSTLERLAGARADAEAAKRQAAENQLRLLQSQLEPHMLFNTLANLRVLIGMDPAQAQAMLDRLIAFLRATLGASRVARHPLATEFARIGDYLALMSMRMGPRLAVTLDLPAALRQVPVPPLLLQPLVENSVQHGLEPKVAGGRIHVGARLEGDVLTLEVSDTGIGLNAAAGTAGTGFGLAGIRERIATLYGSAATLELRAAAGAEGGTVATLRLPVTPTAPTAP
jgi:signal transduction histidine kinase